MHAYESRTLVNTYAELINEGTDDDTILIRLTDSGAFKKQSDLPPKSHIGIVYHPALCGESSSKPHLRVPPLRKGGDHLKRLSAIVLRASSWDIAEGHMWFVYDAGKLGDRRLFMLHTPPPPLPPPLATATTTTTTGHHTLQNCIHHTGNRQALLNAFVDSEGKTLMKAVSPISILLDEESVMDRMDLVRGFATIDQSQHVYIVTNNALNLNRHKRLHYHGSNRGSTLAIVELTQWESEETWALKLERKKAVIGPAAKIAVGGPAAGDEGNKKRDKVDTYTHNTCFIVWF